jgi:CPA2 family monovalent cation:H+ antiporter-2
MRWWLTLVARRKSEELFMLNLLLITLGLAWLTELAGLSLALGAFIAGVLVSETEYRTRWAPTSARSTMCCWGCSSSPSA